MPLSILHMLHTIFKFCSPKCLNLPYHKWEKDYSYYSWHWILAQSISNNVVWKARHPLVPSATTFPKLFWSLHTLESNSIHNHWEAALVIGNKCLASEVQSVFWWLKFCELAEKIFKTRLFFGIFCTRFLYHFTGGRPQYRRMLRFLLL
jgi:hypothetical protein